jgi:hypothetical protein
MKAPIPCVLCVFRATACVRFFAFRASNYKSMTFGGGRIRQIQVEQNQGYYEREQRNLC